MIGFIFWRKKKEDVVLMNNVIIMIQYMQKLIVYKDLKNVIRLKK